MRTILIIISSALALALAGCVYKGAKVTEGTDFSVGLSVPATDGAASMTVLNYLSGFRLGVAENCRLTVDYTSSATNSYFGIAETRTHKTVRAKVVPCEAAPDGDEPGEQEKEQ